MNENIDIDALLIELGSRNLPVCDKAIYAINAMRGKRTIIKGEDEPAPATVEAAVAAQDP